MCNFALNKNFTQTKTLLSQNDWSYSPCNAYGTSLKSNGLCSYWMPDITVALMPCLPKNAPIRKSQTKCSNQEILKPKTPTKALTDLVFTKLCVFDCTEGLTLFILNVWFLCYHRDLLTTIFCFHRMLIPLQQNAYVLVLRVCSHRKPFHHFKCSLLHYMPD